MNLVTLTANQRLAILRALHDSEDVGHYRGLSAVLQLDRGTPIGEIAESLGETRQSIYNWART